MIGRNIALMREHPTLLPPLAGTHIALNVHGFHDFMLSDTVGGGHTVLE